MHLKQTRLVLLIIILFSSLTACSPPTIDEVNCREDDINANPPFLMIDEETAPPSTAPFPDQMTAYHRVALSEYQLTYTDALCTIRTYRDTDIADAALRYLCLQGQGTQTAMVAGDDACSFQDGGVVELHFRRGVSVVTVREDLNGSHVAQWAAAVDKRLKR